MEALKSKVELMTHNKSPQGNLVLIKVDDKELFSQLGEEDVEITISINKIVKITAEQRGTIFELISNYGKKADNTDKLNRDRVKHYKEYFYEMFKIKNGLDEFSLSKCTTEQADMFITMMKNI